MSPESPLRSYFSHLPIRIKLVAIMISITAIALILGFSLSLYFYWQTSRENSMDRLQTMGEVVALQSVAPLQFMDPIAAYENLESLGLDPRMRKACLYDSNGEQFAAYVADSHGPNLCPPLSHNAGRVYHWKDIQLFLPVYYQGELIGSLYMRYELSDVRKSLLSLILYKVVIFILVMLLIWPVSNILQRIISAPIIQLADISRRFSREQKEPLTVTKRSNDEIGELVEAYNTMMTEIYQNKKRIEEANQNLRNARDRAESANRAKSDFMANISHEIRTPMNAVVGLTYVLGKSEPLTSKQKEFIHTMETSANNLLVLINDLLDFTKIEQQAIELETAPFNLRDIMDETLSLHRIKSEEKGLKLLSNYLLPNRIFMGDAHRIQQIIGNLVSNAIKFTATGSITVTAEPPLNRTGIILRIRDTGIGIKPDFLPTLFEKFTQADASITRQYGGSGLGLAICKGLIDQMGGTIDVKSEFGDGSEFIIYLPLLLGAEEKEEPANNSGEDNKGNAFGHILLVEDYAANVLVAKTLIEGLGYHCDVASNGFEALEKTAKSHFDVVLMDVQMQGMDGLEATRRIRERERTTKTPPLPIIAMTAHAALQDRQRCLDAGMDNYISKPFQPNELEEILRYYISLRA